MPVESDTMSNSPQNGRWIKVFSAFTPMLPSANSLQDETRPRIYFTPRSWAREYISSKPRSYVRTSIKKQATKLFGFRSRTVIACLVL